MKPLEVCTCQRAENLKKKSSKIPKNSYAATMVLAAGRQIIGGGGGAPINKKQRPRPQIVGGGARLYFGSTLDSYSVSCVGSNEETGCSLHVTNRLPIDPENPRGPVGLVAPSSASNRWRRGSSLAWNRHTSHCSGCS